MKPELIDLAKRHHKIETRITELEEKIQEMQRDSFGADSEDTAKKARELFSEIADGDSESSTTNEIDALEEEKQELQAERAEVSENLKEKLVHVTFPLNEEIENDGESVRFPYSEPIEQEVLDAINTVLDGELSNGKVSIESDAITVDTDSVGDAIDAVESQVTTIRETADVMLNVESRVESIHGRDGKVAAMLHVLHEGPEEGLTKKEMEEEIGLESGDLRGQLYYVLKNDPYMNKSGKKVSLTATGGKVIERYWEDYGTPSLISEKPDGQDGEDTEAVAQ